MSNFVYTNDLGKPVFLHEWVWIRANKKAIPKGFKVFHKNGNKLDNTRKNLDLTPCKPGEEYMGDMLTTNEDALGVRGN